MVSHQPKVKEMGRKNYRRSSGSTWKGIGITLLILVVLGIVGAVVMSLGGNSEEEEQRELINEQLKNEASIYPPDVSKELFGKTSTVSFAAFDKESSSNDQVNVTGYFWVAKWIPGGKDAEGNELPGQYGEYTYGGSLALLESSRVTTTTPTVGDIVKVIAFDSTYPYGLETEFVVTQQSVLKNLDVYKGSASQSITMYDQDGNTIAHNVTVGTTQYTLEKLRFANTDDYSTIRPKLIGFDYSETTNISEVQMSGLKKYTEKIERLKTLEDVFIFEPGDVNNDQTQVDTGTVTIKPDGDDVASETVTIYVVDSAPYIDNNNMLQYGFETDDQTPLGTGIADVTQALLLI